MSQALVQAASTLYLMDTTTGTTTTLTLPAGITLQGGIKPKFATLNQWTAMVNSPSENLVIDPEGVVRPLTLRPPVNGPEVAAGGGTGLTGAYTYRVSFIILNSDGQLLSESPLSPPSVAITLANQNASLTKIPLSLDSITGRRLYRTLSGGTLYFQVIDILDNTSTALLDNNLDATVTLLPAAPTALQMPPGATPGGVKFKTIVEWKSRLWAVASDSSLVDTIYISDTNKVYTWPNTVTAFPTGQDSQGVVAFAPRRNQLGLLKRNGLWQISGTSSSTGIAVTNVSVSQIAVNKAGCIAPDTVVVINDKAYWLGKDGVYEWSDDGVQTISDEVYPWFKSNTFFNRSDLAAAYAKYNELRNSYEIHLPNIGGSDVNRWVSFNLDNRRWYGPHKTDAFIPTHAAHMYDANSLPIFLVGGLNGIVYLGNSTSYVDGTSTAIDFDCFTPFYSIDAPDIDHVWLEMSFLSKIEAAGTLTVTPYVGRLDAVAGDPILVDLTKGRQRLRRLGEGALMRLRIRQADVNQGCSPYGFEVPVWEVGRR